MLCGFWGEPPESTIRSSARLTSYARSIIAQASAARSCEHLFIARLLCLGGVTKLVVLPANKPKKGRSWTRIASVTIFFSSLQNSTIAAVVAPKAVSCHFPGAPGRSSFSARTSSHGLQKVYVVTFQRATFNFPWIVR